MPLAGHQPPRPAPRRAVGSGEAGGRGVLRGWPRHVPVRGGDEAGASPCDTTGPMSPSSKSMPCSTFSGDRHTPTRYPEGPASRTEAKIRSRERAVLERPPHAPWRALVTLPRSPANEQPCAPWASVPSRPPPLSAAHPARGARWCARCLRTLLRANSRRPVLRGRHAASTGCATPFAWRGGFARATAVARISRPSRGALASRSACPSDLPAPHTGRLRPAAADVSHSPCCRARLRSSMLRAPVEEGDRGA